MFSFKVTLVVNGEERETFGRSGDTKHIEDHTQHFQHGDEIEVVVEAENGATLTSDATSSGYVIDLTPPVIDYLKDHPQDLKYQTSDSEVFAAWQFHDDESGIIEYKYRILGK